MKILVGVHPNRKRYTLALAGVLLLIAIPTWAVTPVEVATLVASDGTAGDQFGVRVSVSGATALIGARFDDNKGAAYVFVRSGNTWIQQAKLTAADGAAGDQFGVSVSVSGDTAVIGTVFDDDDGSDSGSAYVFIRSGTTWTHQDKLTTAEGAAGDQFGVSVSISGNTAVVGANFGDGIVADSGSAYVFAPDPIIAAIEDLIATVVSLNLQQGIENALDVVIQFLDNADQNNNLQVSNVLVAFIQMVEAQRGKELTGTQADELVDAAQAIIDSLSI